MEHQSIKKLLLERLKDGEWRYAGTLEDDVRLIAGTKASCVSRRLREMFNAGVIEREYRKVEGVPNKVVCYRLKVLEPSQWDLPKKIIIPSLF